MAPCIVANVSYHSNNDTHIGIYIKSQNFRLKNYNMAEMQLSMKFYVSFQSLYRSQKS